jgi:hypothetical protein
MTDLPEYRQNLKSTRSRQKTVTSRPTRQVRAQISMFVLPAPRPQAVYRFMRTFSHSALDIELSCHEDA